MRIMRGTIYSEDYEAVSVVARDCDLTDTLESARERTKVPGSLCVYDILEAPDGLSVEDATKIALLRNEARFEAEHMMAISYYWNANALRLVVAGGLVGNPDPAPLSAEDCATVLVALATHPNWDHQTIYVVAKDGTRVTLSEDGVIEEESE